MAPLALLVNVTQQLVLLAPQVVPLALVTRSLSSGGTTSNQVANFGTSKVGYQVA